MPKVYGMVMEVDHLPTGPEVEAALGTTAVVVEVEDYQFGFTIPGYDPGMNHSVVFIHESDITYLAHDGNNYVDDPYFHSRLLTLENPITVEGVEYMWTSWLYDRIDNVSDYPFLLRQDIPENVVTSGDGYQWRYTWWWHLWARGDEGLPSFVTNQNRWGWPRFENYVNPNSKIFGPDQYNNLNHQKLAGSGLTSQYEIPTQAYSPAGRNIFHVWWASTKPLLAVIQGGHPLHGEKAPDIISVEGNRYEIHHFRTRINEHPIYFTIDPEVGEWREDTDTAELHDFPPHACSVDEIADELLVPGKLYSLSMSLLNTYDRKLSEANVLSGRGSTSNDIMYGEQANDFRQSFAIATREPIWYFSVRPDGLNLIEHLRDPETITVNGVDHHVYESNEEVERHVGLRRFYVRWEDDERPDLGYHPLLGVMETLFEEWERRLDPGLGYRFHSVVEAEVGRWTPKDVFGEVSSLSLERLTIGDIYTASGSILLSIMYLGKPDKTEVDREIDELIPNLDVRGFDGVKSEVTSVDFEWEADELLVNIEVSFEIFSSQLTQLNSPEVS